MRKLFRFGKRIIALFSILLMCTSNYATTSSNDGSAFITKAEFDSLINDFNNQMNIYQSGLNAKIDNAVAGYIAGASGTLSTTKDLFYKNWPSISAINGVIDPTFSYPSVNVLVGGGSTDYYSADNWTKRYTISFNRRYIYNNTASNIRPLVSCSGSESAPGTYYWAGVSYDYDEMYTSSIGLHNYSTGQDLADVEDGGISATLNLRNAFTFNISDGYNSGFASDTIINPTVFWKSSGQSWSNTLQFGSKNNDNITNISASDINYRYIIGYSGTDKWCVSNPNFTKTFRTHSKNTYNSNGMNSVISKSGTAGVTCSRSTGTPYRSNTISMGDEVTSSKVYPSVGMIKDDIAVSNIILTNEEVKYKASNTNKTLDNLSLEKGFPLFYAEKDVEIEWSPIFVTGQAYDTSNSSWITSTATRVKLFLSLGPFSDKTVSSEIIEGESAEGTATDGGIYCNIGEAQKVSFKMPDNGVVYAKWVPDTATYDTERWIQPLNISGCNTYVEKKKGS